VAWLPDSRHLVHAHTENVAGWTALAPVMSDTQRKEIEARAPKLRDELLAYDGDWKDFKGESFKGFTGGEIAALLIFVREKPGPGLAEKLGEHWKELQEVQASVQVLHLANVSAAGEFALDRVLAKSLDPFDALRVAPNGKLVAYRGGAPGEDQARPLFVLAIDGGTPRQVAERTAMFPDWSADSRTLVYASTRATLADDGKDLRLGVVARRKICGDDGALLAEFPDAEELAGIVFQNELRVRCLRDGRVLFATLDVQLPSTSEDMPQRASLFAINPGVQPGVSRVIPRQTEEELPDALVLFEASPDEQHIAVAGGNGRVAVVTLATGAAWQIVAEKEVDHLRTVPAWRSADELTFAIVPGSEADKGRAQIVLAKLNFAEQKQDRRVLSQDWPESVATEFLTQKQEPAATQPTKP
jgi:hypothetical protein